VGREIVVDRISTAAGFEDDGLLARIRNQVRLLGDGILIAGEIVRIAGKISKADR